MTTKRIVNAEKGKQGFQKKKDKSEPENLSLAQSADEQLDALLEARRGWTTRLTSLAQESFDVDSAFIAEKARETHPDALAVCVRVQYDNGNLTADAYDVLVRSGFVRISEGDDDYEDISNVTKTMSRRNRQRVWREGRGPLGGPAYVSINLERQLNSTDLENLGVNRAKTRIAVTEAEGEIMRVETTLAAIALRDIGLTEVRYTVESSFDKKITTVKVTDVTVAPAVEMYYTQDSARHHAEKVITSNMGTHTLHAVAEHQAEYNSSSVIDRYDTEYNPLDENQWS